MTPVSKMIFSLGTPFRFPGFRTFIVYMNDIFFGDTLQVPEIQDIFCQYEIEIVPQSGASQINIEGSRAYTAANSL